MASNKKTGTAPVRLLLLFLMLLFGASTLFFAWKVVDHLLDARKSRAYWDTLQRSVVVTDTPAQSRPSQAPETQAEEEPDTEEPAIPQSIDFDSLRSISGNAVAWLFAPDSPINYVVAQGADNDYYLRRLLDGTPATGGTLFVDHRCAADFSDWNTIIYGHYMKNGTMFGTLANYRDSGYYETHPVIYLYLPEKRYELELIAGYTTDVYDPIYSPPASQETRDEILAHALRLSDFASGVTVGQDDRLVTLSTCAYDYENARYVVIGRLLEQQDR